MAEIRKVSFPDFEDGENGNENGYMDPDLATDAELLRGKKTWSRKQFERITKIFDQQPSRKKIFSEIQTTTDLKTWEIEDFEKNILCAKVYNPAILNPNNEKWDEITQVQRLEVEDPEGIMTEISKHVAQELKRMDSFSMTWTKVKSLPISIFHQNMRTLSLPRNQIRSLNGIEAAENLEYLDVSSNMLTVLPDELGRMTSLISLNVSGNGIKELPQTIGHLNSLKLLDCSSNKLKTLPDSIGNLIELQDFDVGNNYLTSLPETIGLLTKLDDLRARSNQLTQLPMKFSLLFNLTSLLLRKNKFTEVPEQLSSLSKLQNLNMKDNLIATMQISIPSLKSLILDGNQFTQIDRSILLCSNLQMLWLQNNLICEIPDDIKLLKNLRALHLSQNQIQDVPMSITQLDYLRHVSLRSTGIKVTPIPLTNKPHITVELDETSLKKRPVGDRHTILSPPNIISRIRNSIFAPGASVGRNFLRSNVKSTYPAPASASDDVDDDDDEFEVCHYKNKRDTLQPKQMKDEEALELQARQGKMVAGKLQSRNQEASEE